MVIVLRFISRLVIMERFFKSFVLLLCILLLSSCQEGGEAGDLFGQWRLVGHDTQYISFSGSLTLLRSTDEAEVIGNFQHVDIRLRIEDLNSDHFVLSKDGRIWSFYPY